MNPKNRSRLRVHWNCVVCFDGKRLYITTTDRFVMNVATVCHKDIAAQEGGLIPYISHIAYVPPQMIGPSFGPFWSENGCRLPILVSLESGIVFEGTTRVYELIYLLFSIPNEQERTRNIRIHSGIQEIFFIAVLIYEMTDIISEARSKNGYGFKGGHGQRPVSRKSRKWISY